MNDIYIDKKIYLCHFYRYIMVRLGKRRVFVVEEFINNGGRSPVSTRRAFRASWTRSFHVRPVNKTIGTDRHKIHKNSTGDRSIVLK